MSLCCAVGYKWVTVKNGIQFEFNESLYMKNDFKRKRFISLGYLN